MLSVVAGAAWRMPHRSPSCLQLNRYPDRTRAARAKRGVHHRDAGEAVFDGRNVSAGSAVEADRRALMAVATSV